MPPVRALLRRRHLAALLCAAALLLKLLVPGGYMIDGDHGRLTIALCAGTAPAMTPPHRPTMHAAMPDHRKSESHDKAEQPCAFSGLSAAALGAIDPVLLAALIAFVMACVAARTMPPPALQRAYLRPPLRGPPLRL